MQSGCGISLGELTTQIIDGAEPVDSYPSTQAWAEECERALEFAKAHGTFEDYLPRLQGDARQRDAALAEIRVALFLSSNRWEPQPGTWQPNGGPAPDGEFVVESPGGSRVAVEVKHRDWQGELTKDEIEARRQQLPKHLGLEVRTVAPQQSIHGAVDRAYGKFDGETPSLLIVSNDLFLDLETGPDVFAEMALYSTDLRVVLPVGDFRFPAPRSVVTSALSRSPAVQTGYFTDPRYENLGGLGIFGVEGNGYEPVRYTLRLYVNGFALPSAKLPREFVTAFRGRRSWDDPTNQSLSLGTRWLDEGQRLDRDTVLRVLRAAQGILLKHFGLKKICLFGSAARGENGPESDLDFLVEISGKTFANYMGLKEYLETLFCCRADLVLAGSLKPALQSAILAECVHAEGL